MLKEGDKAPSFKAKDQDGKIYSFGAAIKGITIIYFYPKAMTPGCTAESCSIRDYYDALLRHGFNVIGISPDMPDKQKKFGDTYQLPFPLLSDPNHEIMNKYGVWGEKQLYGKKFMGVIRTTFIVEKGRIIKVFNKPKTKIHGEEILNYFNLPIT